MAARGEAADYYSGAPAPPAPTGYPPGREPKPEPYGQQPPQYGYAPPQGPPHPQQGYGDNKVDFDQAFAIQKPKFHDWWAGLLFIAVFLGYVAVSGITINGYCKCSVCRMMARRLLTMDASFNTRFQWRWHLRWPK